MLAIVGESGSGKTTLLHLIAGLLTPDAGEVRYRMRDGVLRDHSSLSEAERRALMRTDWGFVHQDAARGLAHERFGRRQCRRAADGGRRAALWPHPRHAPPNGSSASRSTADRIDDAPRTYSGRHAPAPADRAQSRDRAAPRVHGRADRRARCFGAGAAPRSHPRPRRRTGARGRAGDARSRRGAAALATGSW